MTTSTARAIQPPGTSGLPRRGGAGGGGGRSLGGITGPSVGQAAVGGATRKATRRYPGKSRTNGRAGRDGWHSYSTGSGGGGARWVEEEKPHDEQGGAESIRTRKF